MARPKNTLNDPDRRERIVNATMEILLESGVSAVSARAVARRVEVPVGSVSYYFDSIKALLIEASQRVAEERLAGFKAWRETVTLESVVDKLAESIHHQLTDVTAAAQIVLTYQTVKVNRRSRTRIRLIIRDFRYRAQISTQLVQHR